MANERWKYVVFNKDITEEESLDFYTTWAKDVRVLFVETPYSYSQPKKDTSAYNISPM